MDIIPNAKVVHRMAGRIRFRVKGIETDRAAYFEGLNRKFKEKFRSETVRVNAATGSLVVAGPGVDLDSVVRFAREERLFQLTADAPSAGNLVTHHAKRHVRRIENGIAWLTRGRLDMGSSVFLVLVVHAMREIARGRFGPPSGFTALWFAATIYQQNFTGTGADDGGCCDCSDAGQ